jgi:hypothetical protein
MRLFAIFALLINTAWARPTWVELEKGQAYRLTHNFTFPSGFSVAKGEEVVVNFQRDLGIGAILTEVEAVNCTFPGVEENVELFPVPTEIGLSVQPDCLLWFYFLPSEIYTEAPLE